MFKVIQNLLGSDGQVTSQFTHGALTLEEAVKKIQTIHQNAAKFDQIIGRDYSVEFADN